MTVAGRNVARALATALAAAVVADAALAQPAITSPRSLYVLHCAGCHGMDASGVPGQGVPSMRGNLGLFMQVPEGRAFLLQVPGVNNAGLTDAQIALVTNWMVQTFSADTAPSGWAAYTAAEVATAKVARPADVVRARADLVARLQRDGHVLK